MSLLGFLVTKLAVIEDSADRRLGRWRDFDQIESGFFGHVAGHAEVNNAEWFSGFSDQANLRDVDLSVDPMRLLQCDG